MRYFLLLVLGVVLLSAADQDASPPTMPGEVTLTSGRVLRNVSVIRWEKDRVVLKHAAGADPIPFAMFKSPAPGELPAMKAAFEETQTRSAADLKAKQAAATQQATRSVEYNGEMAVDAEVGSSFPLAGMQVYVLSPESAKILERPPSGALQYELPAPLAHLETDVNGHFAFTLPAGQKFTVLGQSRRKIFGRWEEFEWRIPSEQITDPAHIRLHSGNRRAGNAQIVFGK